MLVKCGDNSVPAPLIDERVVPTMVTSHKMLIDCCGHYILFTSSSYKAEGHISPFNGLILKVMLFQHDKKQDFPSFSTG